MRLQSLCIGGPVVAAVLVAAPALADEIHMKGGGRVSGRIVETTDTRVTIETGPGRVTLPLSRVARIVEGRSALEVFAERVFAAARPGPAARGRGQCWPKSWVRPPKKGHEGVRLAIEPLNRYESDIVNTADEGLAFIQEVGHSHLGLLLDTFHVNIEEVSLYDCFRQTMAAGRLWDVHLGDSNRLPPGQGHIDFPGILTTLREIRYDGFLSAELLSPPDPDAPGIATAATMRQLVETVTGVI